MLTNYRSLCLKFLFFLILFSAWIVMPVSADTRSTSRVFLSSYAQRIIHEAESVEAAPLAIMRKYPSHIWPGDPRFYRILKAEQKLKLVDLLQNAEEIDPQLRLKQCDYEPGINFTFHMKSISNDSNVPFGSQLESRFKSRAFSILLCFNCDLWAIGGDSVVSGSQRPEEVAFFGDAKPNRKALESLAMELFGKEFFEIGEEKFLLDGKLKHNKGMKLTR